MLPSKIIPARVRHLVARAIEPYSSLLNTDVPQILT